MSDDVSTAEASTILDCSKQWVIELINAGELDARKIGNYYAITKASVEAYKARKGTQDKSKK
jgi:excisionase family DNA binding protein